jgi:hypothetical protein
VSFLTEPISIIPIKPKRLIGEIAVNVVLNESTSDVLTITKQPVQQGASITDHAYKEPTVFTTSILFKYNLTKSLSKIYQELIDLQNSRTPFDIITPKRIYRNMLIATLSQTTDLRTENCLAINLACQEIIIVKVSTTQVPRSKQKNPGTTGKTENAGKKSALQSLKEGIGGLF